MLRSRGGQTVQFTSGPPSVKRAHLDRRPTGDCCLTPPLKCLVQIGGFQHRKTAYVLGLRVWPVGDEHLCRDHIGKPADRDGETMLQVSPRSSLRQT